MAESKDCHSCGAPYQSKFENCIYCGEPIRSERVLTSVDEKRIFWLLQILDTRVWRYSFDFRFSVFQKCIFFLFGLGLSTFLLSFFLNKNLISSVCISIIILVNPVFSLYKDFKNYIDSIALVRYFDEKIRNILNQFMEGYNHSLGDIEYVMYKNEGLNFIKKCMIEKRRVENSSTGLEVIADHLAEIFDMSCYHQSLKKTSYFFLFSGFGLFIFYFATLILSNYFFHQWIEYTNYICLMICSGICIWLYFEQIDLLNVIFNYFDYHPDHKLMREKWGLVKSYFTFKNFKEADFRKILDQNNNFIRLNNYLSEKKFFSDQIDSSQT